MIEMVKISNWSKEQQQIVREMLQVTKSKKWIRISHKLRENNYHRTPSQCRQRFINYLAPNIDKSQITPQQLQTIYEKYEQLGPKWSVIQLHVQSKTQCKIKNVFYGNVKNLLKTVYKYFTFKTAPFVNSIPTDYLQAIYDASLQFDGITQAKEGIRVMEYRNNKYKLIRYIQQHQNEFLVLLNTVLKEVFKQAPIKVALNDEHQKRVRKLLRNQNNEGERQEKGHLVKRQEGDSNQQEPQQSQVFNESPSCKEPAAPQIPSFAIKTQTIDICIKQQASNEILTDQKNSQIYPFKNYPIREQSPHYYPQPYIPYGQYFSFPQLYPL